jgi:hypothetical protein
MVDRLTDTFLGFACLTATLVFLIVRVQKLAQARHSVFDTEVAWV